MKNYKSIETLSFHSESEMNIDCITLKDSTSTNHTFSIRDSTGLSIFGFIFVGRTHFIKGKGYNNLENSHKIE